MPKYIVTCAHATTGARYELLVEAGNQSGAVSNAAAAGHLASASHPLDAPSPDVLQELLQELKRIRFAADAAESIQRDAFYRFWKRLHRAIIWALTLAVVFVPVFWFAMAIILLMAAGGLGNLMEWIER